MTGSSRSRQALLQLLAAAPLGAVLAAAPAPTSTLDPPTATAEQLAAAVIAYDVAGSVRPVETERVEEGETVLDLDSDILFDFASADLEPNAVARIGELVADVPEGAAVSVTGHTDDVGEDADNLVLSQRRAQAVADAVAAARADLVLEVRGRGEAEPVAPNSSGGEDDPEGRAQNRRVELRYGAS